MTGGRGALPRLLGRRVPGGQLRRDLGLAHRSLSGIEALGIDEIQWHRGHHYLPLVYQIDAGARRRLWVALDRTEDSLRGFFLTLTDEVKASIRYLCSDLWMPYLNVLAQEVSRFWTYLYPGWARRFLREWCTRTMRSRIEPMKEVARTLRNHEGLILNGFKARGTISAGVTEGLNNNLKLTTRKAYRFRTFDAVKVALYHNPGALPEPEFTHRSC